MFNPAVVVGGCRYDIARDNASKSEPLARALKEVEVLRAALASADKDKASLAQAKARLAAAEKQVRRPSTGTARTEGTRAALYHPAALHVYVDSQL